MAEEGPKSDEQLTEQGKAEEQAGQLDEQVEDTEEQVEATAEEDTEKHDETTTEPSTQKDGEAVEAKENVQEGVQDPPASKETDESSTDKKEGNLSCTS